MSRDEDLAALGRMTSLEWLNLAGLGPVSGTTFGMLANLSRLEYLNMSMYQLQNKHLAAVTRMSELVNCAHPHHFKVQASVYCYTGVPCSILCGMLPCGHVKLKKDCTQNLKMHYS